MTETNQQLIDDSIHGRGAFSDVAIQNYVDPQDLRAARFHHSAGCKFLELSKEEESKIEREGLVKTARYHFHQTDMILKKYESREA